MNNNYLQCINEYLEAPQTYAARKDGVPLELLDQLTPAEKEQATEALIEKLSRLISSNAPPCISLCG